MTDARSSWASLLRLALPALDHVFGGPNHDEPPDWTLGGGTAIMLHIDHRISHDIDIFIPGSSLKAFTPARNPGAALISRHVQWPGHYLKFERPEGEIDFLSASLLTDPGFIWQTFEGRAIAVETPEEVVVKKIRYRSERFTARDAFDLAAVATLRPSLDRFLAEEVADVLPRLGESLRILHAKGPAAVISAVIPLAAYAALPHSAVDVARDVVNRATIIAADVPS